LRRQLLACQKRRPSINLRSKVKTYFELKIGPINTLFGGRDKDILTQFCFEHGCSGIAETLPFDQKTLVYEPEIFENKSTYMSAYFENPPTEDFMILLKSKFPEVGFGISEEQEKDWLKIWKENFKPFHFAGDYWIVPSWCDVPAEAKKYLLIDPGMAFGTGTHETTKLAAEWYFKAGKPTSVLDVGMGTGILSFIAKREGATTVVGVDIDAECVRVAKENAELNKISGIQFNTTRVEKIEEKFDHVFANIVSGVLLAIRESLVRTVKTNGTLILAGILKDEKENFIKEFMADGSWELIGNKDLNEWTSYLLKRK
jgi:ribosomal protein L11 methyltransferase